MNRVFIDVETGGLSYRGHALTAMAAVVFDPDYKTIAVWDTKIKPLPDLYISDDAAKLQGYQDQAHLRQSQQFASSEQSALESLRQFLIDWLAPDNPDLQLPGLFRKFGHRIWAHNASFDSAFLMEAYYRVNETVIRVPFGCSCSLLHANRILPESQTPGGSLLKLARFFGIEFPNQHSPVADSRVGIAVLRALDEYQRAGSGDGQPLAGEEVV